MKVDPKKIGEAIDKLIKHAHCPRSKRSCMGGRYDTCLKCWVGYLAKEALNEKADLLALP